MNAGMTLSIISLLVALATAGGAAKHQAGTGDGPSISGFNLNHNETLVRETNFGKVGPASCPKWICGANHNETLVRDTALVQQSNDWSLWMSSESFAASVLMQFSMYRGGPGCSPWVCGSNHNETLVRDAALVQQSNDWSLWKSSESFAAAVLMQFSMYRGGGGSCPP